MVLPNKTVLVTGGSSGLGFSLAKKLIEKGCSVYILGRHQDKLEKASSQIDSSQIHILLGDVTNFKQVQDLVVKLNIDILINNAGIWLEGKIDANTEEQISQVIDINLKGVIYTTKAILPQMLERNNGYILNIISTSGLKGREDQAVYVATKFGVSGFTKSLELDLANTNIKVAGIYPGGMNTELFVKAGNPKNNEDWMDTNKVAEVVIFMLERDDTMIISSLELNKRVTKTSNK